MKRLNCYPVVTLIIWLIFSPLLSAAYLRNIPRILRQPDGTVLECYASGDEFYHWLHDENNRTIIKDPATGFYVYANLVQDRLVPSKYIAGKVIPGLLEIQPGLNIPYSIIQRRRAEHLRLLNINDAYKAPTTGEINNIVVFIKFADQVEFVHPLSEYSERFNTGTPSLQQYYAEVSYSQLAIQSHFYPDNGGAPFPVSYHDSYNRGHYEAYDAITNPDGYPVDENGDPADDEARIREHTLLRNAVAAVAAQVPADLNIDSDDDGLVDNVCFVIRGSEVGWSDLLWPHMWVLWSFDPDLGDMPGGNATINGITVWTYNFNIDDFTGSAGSGVGVLAHEMFHTLGAPDLYHYNYDGLEPVGSWDLMEQSGDPPHHMGAYMKYRYGGWIPTIPEISSKGIYSLTPLTSSQNNCYKIASPSSTSEYFVVEYRRQEGTYESTVPGTGLLVYRINSTLDGEGNADGPPDEVYLFRPGGTLSINGSPELAHFSIDYGRSEFNSITDPYPFLSDGSPGGIGISNIGSAGTSIQFEIIGLPDLVAGSDCAEWEYSIVISYSAGTFKTDGFSGVFPKGYYYINSVIQNIGEEEAIFQDDQSLWKVFLDGVMIQNWGWWSESQSQGYYQNLNLNINVALSVSEETVWRVLQTSRSSEVANASLSTYPISPGECVVAYDPGDPIYLSAGEHTLTMEIDPDNYIAEKSELNNTFERIITIEENIPPIDFAIVSPVVGSEVNTLTPKLTWRSAKDSDPEDTVKYEISLDTPDPGVETITVGTDTTYTISTPLQDNISYYWKVTASDLAGATAESTGGYQSFVINLSNEPPSAFLAIYPEDESVGHATEIAFIWQKTTDPDPLDQVSYSLIYATDWSESSTHVRIGGITETFVTVQLGNNKEYFWLVEASDLDGLITQSNNGEPMRLVVGTLDTYTSNMIPTEFALHQNYPNPFNPGTTIRFDVPVVTSLSLVVYDILGREVVRLREGYLEPGYHQIVWNGRTATGTEASAGVYILRMISPVYTRQVKMVLMK